MRHVGHLLALARRHRSSTALILTLLLVTLPFLEILVGSKSGMWGDVTTTHIPRYRAAWRNVRSDASPFWWGDTFAGFNSLGAGQSAPLYPLTALFGWLPAGAAFRVWFFGHIWLMAAGWFRWSWRHWSSVTASAVSGVTAVLSGYFVYHSMFMPYVAGLALLPWLFLSLDCIVETGRARYVAAFALLTGSVVVLGMPQFLWLSFMCLGIYALFRLVSRTTAWSRWLNVVSAFVLGAALGAAQLLPQYVFGGTSVRPRLTKSGAFEYSMEWRHLWTLITPNIMGGSTSLPGRAAPWQGGLLQHEVAGYVGVTVLALALAGAVAERRTRIGRALMTLALLGLLTSLGGRTPLGSLFFDAVPFASRFRVWGRNQLWLLVAVAMLSGAGVRAVLRAARRSATALLYGAIGVAALAIVLPAMTDLGGALLGGRDGLIARLRPAVFLALLAAAVLMGTRRRHRAPVLVLAVCILDLGFFALAAPWRAQSLPTSAVSETFNDSPPPFGGAIDAPGGLDRWASDIADASSFWPEVVGHRSLSVNGYDPLLQVDYSDTLGGMAYNGYVPAPGFWQGGWVPDILRTTTLLASGYAGSVGSGWTSQGQTGPNAVYSYEPRLADAYLVGEAKVRSLDQARAGIYDPNTPLTEFAYVDTTTIDSRDTPRFAQLAQPGPSGTVINGAMDDGGHGRWTVNAERPSLFVTSYAWMEGWTATVDGQPVPVARTNALVLGVPVPAGQHEVQLTFTPPGWTTGRNITIIALTITLLLLALDNRWGRSTVTALRRLVRRPARSRDSATTTS